METIYSNITLFSSKLEIRLSGPSFLTIETIEAAQLLLYDIFHM
jgi:hypothetical protein